jgi:hypothetical protein
MNSSKNSKKLRRSKSKSKSRKSVRGGSDSHPYKRYNKQNLIRSRSRRSRGSGRRVSRRVSRRQGRRIQRGGNYFLDVNASRIGGLPEVARIDDPIAPIAGASSRAFPDPLFTKPEQTTVKVPSTVPGPYEGSGMASIFDDKMTGRDFSCKGPSWQPTCI